MIEIPEANTIVHQINKFLRGKKVIHVTANHSPHKFAWYHKDPAGYGEILKHNTILEASAYGGMIHVKLDSSELVFEDFSKLSATVMMYGGLWCFKEGSEYDNPYFEIAKEKISPLSKEFTESYFNELLTSQVNGKLSVKAFLATEQRIPGLGNGVLQDILWSASLNPKSKIVTLNEEQIHTLYISVKTILKEMTERGSRDTEKDLLGNKGGYKTYMSKNTVGTLCIRCGGVIKKENYLGGSIYYCETCRK